MKTKKIRKTKKVNKQKIIKTKKIKLSKNFLTQCKQLLIKKHNELANINFKDSEEIMPDVGDDIDLARITLDKEIVHELTDTQKNLLDLINSALDKIDKKGDAEKVFGICEHCHKPIPQKRLKVIPWAKYCIKCQINTERIL